MCVRVCVSVSTCLCVFVCVTDGYQHGLVSKGKRVSLAVWADFHPSLLLSAPVIHTHTHAHTHTALVWTTAAVSSHPVSSCEPPAAQHSACVHDWLVSSCFVFFGLFWTCVRCHYSLRTRSASMGCRSSTGELILPALLLPPASLPPSFLPSFCPSVPPSFLPSLLCKNLAPCVLQPLLLCLALDLRLLISSCGSQTSESFQMSLLIHMRVRTSVLFMEESF